MHFVRKDVIFSGTAARKAQGFAEVTLRLDNSDGALANPEKEVSVTRRYYRSGESGYLINGKPCASGTWTSCLWIPASGATATPW